MKRNQVIFFVIITLALGVVFISQIVSGLGGEGDTSEGQPPPPPEGSIVVVVQSHNTKEVWMERMEAEFNAQNFKLPSGELVIVNVEQTGSPLRESLEPVVWSPSDQIRVDEANQDYRDRTNRPLITQACPPTVSIPVGIAMWRPMAEFLGWPDADIRWQDIIDLALTPNGWADPAYGNPQWGRFRYGHGHPEYSSSGRLSVVAQTYAATSKTEGLTVQDVNSPAVRKAVGAIQEAIVHYGRIDTDLLNKMTLRGPSYLHAVTNYESNVVRWNLERGAELAFPLVLVYPADGVFVVDHPICILDNASWVDEKEIQGAQLFIEYITDRQQQSKIPETGIRPAMGGIKLDGPNSPLTTENGVIPSLIPGENIPVLPIPPNDVMQNIIDMWYQVKKPATVFLVLDTSGSMFGDPMKNAIAGTQAFIDAMQPNDRLHLITFSNDVLLIEPSGEVGQVGERLRAIVGGLIADGATALHRAVIEAVDLARQQQAEDVAVGDLRTYSIVLLSDGANQSNDGITEAQMLSLFPSGSEADPDQIHIYTIGYGEDANEALLQTLANRTNGKFYEASMVDINEIYFQISSEF